MAQIVCLANSKKHGGRCVAGIDVETGRWIRPVYHDNPTAGINKAHRDFGGEPQLLDIIDINVDDTGPHLNFQPENRTLFTGKWRKAGSITNKAATKFIESTSPLLFTKTKRIDPDMFKAMSPDEWKSIQLISVKDAQFYVNDFNDPTAAFKFGGITYNLKITDPVIMKTLNQGSFNANTLLTISIGSPHKAPCDDKPYHYKMVAGVIVL